MPTTNNGSEIIRVENIKKSFGSLEVLKDISFSVNQGEVLGIIGPSGSGKSTLLRCICQLETVSDGSISVCSVPMVKNGVYSSKEQLSKIRLDIGLVFQNFNLFPHLTVLQNITLAPLTLKIQTKEEAEEQFGLVNEHIDFVIEGKGTMNFDSTLSGKDLFEEYLKPGWSHTMASHGYLPFVNETTTFIACGKNVPEKIAEIVSGVAEGCVQSGAALIGGETAEHPGLMPEEDYDLAEEIIESDLGLEPDYIFDIL